VNRRLDWSPAARAGLVVLALRVLNRRDAYG